MQAGARGRLRGEASPARAEAQSAAQRMPRRDGEHCRFGQRKLSRIAIQTFVVLYCNFRSLAFLGLLGFLIRQLKFSFLLPS